MTKLRAILLLLCLLAVGRIEAGTGIGTSPSNASVDTTGAASAVVVTMHRATAAVLDNIAATNADERLYVKAAAPADFAALPGLPAWDSLAGTGGGLVADGVTPVIFRIAASGTLPAAGRQYEVMALRGYRSNERLVSPQADLSRPGSRVFQSSQVVTLTPANPIAYVVLNGIRSEQIEWSDYSGPVVATLEVLDATTGSSKGSMDFGVSRPPLVLVHGYNVTDSSWGTYYRIRLGIDRAPGFVIPVGYGLANDFNTTGSLQELAKTLFAVLLDRFEMEGSRPAVLNQWAWTRYDAVGHSQGGVLLRMLCSQQNLNPPASGRVNDLGWTAWRNPRNFNRGRFHRVVTIGSPHVGSTVAELGIQLRARGVRFGSNTASAADIFYDLDRLLQDKFRVGFGSQLQDLNTKLQCDLQARLHLVRTTIYGGDAPGAGGVSGNPQYYEALYLNDATPTLNGQRPGLTVAPNGSDGIVNVESQEAGDGSNHVTAIEAGNFIHAKPSWLPDGQGLIPEQAQTKADTVATKVAELLRGSWTEFGSVNIPASLLSLMETRRNDIAALALAIDEGLKVATEACFAPPPPSPPSALAASPPPPTGNETLHFTLQPPAGEAPNGPVVWTAVVFGPAGTAPSGLTLATTGAYGEVLALTVAGAVQGQVVLSVSFPSTSGKTVLGRPTLVLERPPGTALTGISCTPAVVEGQAGAQISLVVNGTYDGTVTMPIFTNAANTTFASSNTGVASVSGDGRVTLGALGTAQITVTYNGTQVSTVPVTVRDVQPIVTSAASVSGSTGQPLSHQVTASQAVQSFAAAPLPPGLTLNAQTGVITGTPTSAGRFAVILTVDNANGRGSQEFEFAIAGPPGAPTNVGLDASGVSEQKPAGTLVGRFVATSSNPLDTFTFQLNPGTGSSDNFRFTISNGQLFTAQVLDRATTPTVSIVVRVDSSSGWITAKNLVLPVVAPPAIVQQPDARMVFVGDDVIFAVRATGLEPLSYQWKKNGAEVPGATNRFFEVAAAVLGDAGNYTVAVTNGDGSATSAAAGLVVNPISYGRWASALPSTQATALFEPTADYNADGIVNFLDFAFGVSPGIGSALAALPFFARDAFGPVLIYREANGVEPLTYRILKSVSLGAWVDHVPAAGEVTRTNLGTYTEVRVRVPGANPRVFFKIQVASP